MNVYSFIMTSDVEQVTEHNPLTSYGYKVLGFTNYSWKWSITGRSSYAFS